MESIPDPVRTSRESLSVVRQATTQWVSDHATKFDPLREEPADAIPIRRKAFSELAHWLYVVDSYAPSRTETAIRQLVVERANDPAYYELVHRHPDELRRLAAPLVTATRRFELEEAAETTLAAAFESRVPWAAERKAFKWLDLVRLGLLAGRTELPRELDSLARASFLAFPPDPITADVMDAYALTHDFFFATDFGLETAGFVAAPTQFDVADSVVGLLLKYLAQGNTDVVVELLAVGVVEDVLEPELVAFASTWLEEQVDDHLPTPDLDGMPGDVGNPFSPEALAALDDDERHWARNYHVNLAASFLLTMADAHLADAAEERHVTGDRPTAEGLRRLGSALVALDGYKLQTAADHLEALAGTPTARAHESLVARCAEFLGRQRTDDGSYGYWWTERSLFEARSDDGADFDSELVAPVSEQCEAALDAIESVDSGRVR